MTFLQGRRCRFPSLGRLVTIIVGFGCFFGGISLLILVGLDPPCDDCEGGPWIILGCLTIVAGFVLIALGFSAQCDRQPSNNLSQPYEHLRPEEATQDLTAGSYVPYRPYEHRTFQRWINQSTDVQDVYQLTNQGQMTDNQQNLHQFSQQTQLPDTQDTHQPSQHGQMIDSQHNTFCLQQQNQLLNTQPSANEVTQQEISNVQDISSIYLAAQESKQVSSLSNHYATNAITVRQLHTPQYNHAPVPIGTDNLIQLRPTNEQMIQNVSTKSLQHLNSSELSYVSLALIKDDIIIN